MLLLGDISPIVIVGVVEGVVREVREVVMLFVVIFLILVLGMCSMIVIISGDVDVLSRGFITVMLGELVMLLVTEFSDFKGGTS